MAASGGREDVGGARLAPSAPPHFPTPPSATLELGCGLPNPHRFYRTRGHYPGHLVRFHPGLVGEALMEFPQFDGVAECHAHASFPRQQAKNGLVTKATRRTSRN